MVETEVAQPPAPAAPPRKRPIWLTLWVIAPVLFLILLGTSRILYWRASIAYPLPKLVSAGAPAAGQPVNVTATPSGYVLDGPAGTKQMFEFQLTNDGEHAAEIKGVRAADDAVVGIGWAANFVQDGKRVPSRIHALPVRVPRYATVNLVLLVKKPTCSAGSPRYLSGLVTIHWHSMVSPHATKINLLKGHPQRITLCPGR